MARSVDKIKFGLKLRTESKEGALTLRLGTKKYVLPFEARLITSDDYIFVHVPPAAEIMKLDGKALKVVTSGEEAEKAVVSFRKARKSKRRSKKAVELPQEVASALQKIPAGYRLAFDADGSPRLVKMRKRRKKQA
ncbi:hypothetical protein QM565_28640 [Geitlerinema splendidum]|nr:hypothetical protein [Geitlerinema splendidum]